MFLRTGDDVTHTRDHWAGRAHWAGGRRQVTLHATFADTPLAEATASLRAALASMPGLETLVRTQRDAVDRHLGPRGWRPFWPHVSLAYSSAVLPVDRIVDALAEPVADAAAVTVVPTVALVAQACDGATYRWRVLREASR